MNSEKLNENLIELPPLSREENPYLIRRSIVISNICDGHPHYKAHLIYYRRVNPYYRLPALPQMTPLERAQWLCKGGRKQEEFPKDGFDTLLLDAIRKENPKWDVTCHASLESYNRILKNEPHILAGLGNKKGEFYLRFVAPQSLLPQLVGTSPFVDWKFQIVYGPEALKSQFEYPLVGTVQLTEDGWYLLKKWEKYYRQTVKDSSTFNNPDKVFNPD